MRHLEISIYAQLPKGTFEKKFIKAIKNSNKFKKELITLEISD